MWHAIASLSISIYVVIWCGVFIDCPIGVRYKVHLQVIDDTGSITFVMFDRVVSQVLGRTAQDLLDAMNNVR
jgi:hypothetical protein